MWERSSSQRIFQIGKQFVTFMEGLFKQTTEKYHYSFTVQTIVVNRNTSNTFLKQLPVYGSKRGIIKLTRLPNCGGLEIDRLK